MEPCTHTAETSRVVLSPAQERDREDIRNSGAVHDMWTSMPVIPGGSTLDAYFNNALQMAEQGVGLGLIIRSKPDGEFIGFAELRVPDRLHRRTRITQLWISPAHRGSGLTLHVHYLLLKLALEWRTRRVEWWVPMTNQRGLYSLDKMGAVGEGVMRQHSRFADGSWADIAILSLVNDEIGAAMRRLGAQIGETEDASGA